MALELKPIPDEDLQVFHDMMREPDLSRNTGSIPYPIDLDWAQERLDMYRREEVKGTRADRGLYEGNVLVGNAGWFVNERGNREIGYAIHKDHWGRGLGTKVAAMLVTMLRDDGYTGPIYAQHFKDNPASGRVLEKLGFSRVGSVESISAARGGSAPGWAYRLDETD